MLTSLKRTIEGGASSGKRIQMAANAISNVNGTIIQTFSIVANLDVRIVKENEMYRFSWWMRYPSGQ